MRPPGCTRPRPAPVEGELPSFGGATGWLNSPPLTPAGLRGKVALVDFETFTCINWPRQLPYVEQRLYQLIRQPGSVTGHTFEITFLDPGVHAYSFTFG